MALIVLIGASLTFALMRLVGSTKIAMVSSAVLLGVLVVVPALLPRLGRRNALWTFEGNEAATRLMGVRVPTRWAGFRRMSVYSFRVKLDDTGTKLMIEDADVYRTDLAKTACRVELTCTRRGRILGCDIVKGADRASVWAGGRLVVDEQL